MTRLAATSAPRKPTGSLHALYALDTGKVTLDNLGNTSTSGLSVEAKVYNLAGTVLNDQTASNITLTSQQVMTNVLTPVVPTGNPVQVYFVELILRQNGGLVDRNVYWLSTQPDVVNWTKTLGQPQGTETTFANLTSLQTLPASAVSAPRRPAHHSGTGRRPDHHGHDHEYLKLHGRVPAPRRRQARNGRRPRERRRQRAAVLDLGRQRHHALPR